VQRPKKTNEKKRRKAEAEAEAEAGAGAGVVRVWRKKLLPE